MSGHPPAGAQRLDVALVARGLARSRGHARELVDAGQVLVAGRPALKAGARIDPDHDLSLAHDSARWIATTQWVGRGATKLLGALDHWSPQLDVAGRRAADIGASTASSLLPSAAIRGWWNDLAFRCADCLRTRSVGRSRCSSPT